VDILFNDYESTAEIIFHRMTFRMTMKGEIVGREDSLWPELNSERFTKVNEKTRKSLRAAVFT
jgi:hypothetical protein